MYRQKQFDEQQNPSKPPQQNYPHQTSIPSPHSRVSLPSQDPNALLQQNRQLQDRGFENFGAQEFARYPVIAINQPTSDFKPEGKFHNRSTGEIYDSIDVIFLALQRSMAYRPHGFADPRPICHSADALRPDSSVEQPQSHLCHRMTPRGLTPVCPRAQWTYSPTRQAKRDCSLRYTAAIRFNEQHFLLYIQGRAISKLEKFLSQLRHLHQPLFGARITLTLSYHSKKEGFKGNFYELNFPDFLDRNDAHRIQIVDALQFQDEAHYFRKFFDQFAAQNQQTSHSSHEKQTSNNIHYLQQPQQPPQQPQRQSHPRRKIS